MATSQGLDFYSKEAKERQREAGRFEGRNEDGTPKIKDTVQVSAKLHEAEFDNGKVAVGTNLTQPADTGRAAEKAGKVFDV